MARDLTPTAKYAENVSISISTKYEVMPSSLILRGFDGPIEPDLAHRTARHLFEIGSSILTTTSPGQLCSFVACTECYATESRLLTFPLSMFLFVLDPWTTTGISIPACVPHVCIASGVGLSSAPMRNTKDFQTIACLASVIALARQSKGYEPSGHTGTPLHQCQPANLAKVTGASSPRSWNIVSFKQNPHRLKTTFLLVALASPPTLCPTATVSQNEPSLRHREAPWARMGEQRNMTTTWRRGEITIRQCTYMQWYSNTTVSIDKAPLRDDGCHWGVAGTLCNGTIRRSPTPLFFF